MEFAVLGPTSVVDGEAGLKLRGQRLVDVAAVLLVRRGRIVASQAILDLVWDEPGRAPAVVHTVMSRLRQSVGADLIETLPGGYRLSESTRTDADRFDALLHRARDASSVGDFDRAVTAQREALALWRGPVAYEGVSARLVLGERARLEEALASAREELALNLMTRADGADVSEALELARLLIRQNPLRERPWRTAMLAAFRLGRQAEALETYRDLRTRLRDDLGVDPSPESAQLHAQLLAQDPTLLGVRPKTAVGRPHLATGRVPLPPTRTVGRDRELAALRSLFNDGRRLLTLTGPGGVGKTRLLTELGASLRASGPVTYLDLAGADGEAPAQLAERIALATGLVLPQGDPLESLSEALAPGQAIVLIDEADLVTDPLGKVMTALLRRCPGLRVVVASRLPLDIAGETRVPVDPLACPPPGATAEQIGASPAVELLRARLLDRAPHRRIEDLPRLAELVRRVDGLPLGIEIVASYSDTRSPFELAALGDAALDLPAEAGTGAARQHTLRETLRWSTDRLPPAVRRVLAALSTFQGGFDIGAAAAVVGLPGAEVASALSRLVHDCLVQVDRRDDDTRFQLLGIVRGLAATDLAQAGGREECRQRHLRWFAGRWRGASLQDDLLADVGRCYEDYLEALRNALECRDGTDAADLVLTLGRRWLFVEAVGTGVGWFTRVLESRLLDGPDEARVLLLRCALEQQWHWEGQAATLKLLLGALESDPEWLAMTRCLTAIDAYLRGDYPAAAAQSAMMVTLARRVAASQLPEALATHAVMLVSMGDVDGALASAEESWRLVGSAPSATHFVSVVPKIALALVEADQPLRALQVLTRAVDEADRVLGLAPASSILLNAGWAALGADDPATASHWFGRALMSGAPLGGIWLAEAVMGAACALARLDDGSRLRFRQFLHVADELCRRHLLNLSPMQTRQRALALTVVGAGEEGPERFVAVDDQELAIPIRDALAPYVGHQRCSADTSVVRCHQQYSAGIDK